MLFWTSSDAKCAKKLHGVHICESSPLIHRHIDERSSLTDCLRAATCSAKLVSVVGSSPSSTITGSTIPTGGRTRPRLKILVSSSPTKPVQTRTTSILSSCRSLACPAFIAPFRRTTASGSSSDGASASGQRQRQHPSFLVHRVALT